MAPHRTCPVCGGIKHSRKSKHCKKCNWKFTGVKVWTSQELELLYEYIGLIKRMKALRAEMLKTRSLGSIENKMYYTQKAMREEALLTVKWWRQK